MTNISKRLEQVVKKELAQTLIPVKTNEGILVGDVLIKSRGAIKDIIRNDTVLYKEVSLNVVAISLANLSARRQELIRAEKMYQADQEYGRWFIDSQLLRSQYEKYKQQGDFERADVSWARYIESRERTNTAKKTAEQLATI
jgi:hypothetical protein